VCVCVWFVRWLCVGRTVLDKSIEGQLEGDVGVKHHHLSEHEKKHKESVFNCDRMNPGHGSVAPKIGKMAARALPLCRQTS
jgi:hypothetical protein